MTLSDFKTYLKRDFKRTDKDTEIVDAYNKAIMQVAVRIPHGNYKFQSYLACVVGQEDYALPTTLIHLIHPVKLLDGSDSTDEGYLLEKLTKEAYDIREPNPNRTNPSKGKPTAYAVYSSSILLTPIPDSADYLIEINWGRRPTDLSGDLDMSSLGSEWDEVLKWMALSRLYAGLDMMDEAKQWRNLYEDDYGQPIGMYKNLLDIEKEREGSIISNVDNNAL